MFFKIAQPSKNKCLGGPGTNQEKNFLRPKMGRRKFKRRDEMIPVQFKEFPSSLWIRHQAEDLWQILNFKKNLPWSWEAIGSPNAEGITTILFWMATHQGWEKQMIQICPRKPECSGSSWGPPLWEAQRELTDYVRQRDTCFSTDIGLHDGQNSKFQEMQVVSKPLSFHL